MTVLAGVDIGNATTEVVLTCDGTVLGAGRVPTRGRKGSDDSLRAAAALVRRVERRIGRPADEARIAPLRPVDTSLLTVPDVPPSAGRLRTLTAGVPTPGGAGVFVGPPLVLAGGAVPPPAGTGVVAVVPGDLRYDQAVARLRELLTAGVPVGAVLAEGDEGVLIANRLNQLALNLPGLAASIPVIDQVAADEAAACALLAVEARAPGMPLTTLTDPIALSAAFGLADAGPATTLCRSLTDYSNAVVGLAPSAPSAPSAASSAARNGAGEPWLETADGGRFPLRTACALVQDWPPGTVRVLGAPEGQLRVDDLFAVDLAAAAQAATARQGSVGRAVLVASLLSGPPGQDDPYQQSAARLAELLARPVRCLVSEPRAARAGALTTPGARGDALVVDLGAGTIDVIDEGSADIVVAGAGALLTAAVAEMLGISRAAADWVKRGPCIRVDGGQRFEAEDGTRGFLDAPAPAAATGMLAVTGPGGLLPFDRRHGPGEWRAIRTRLKQSVMNANLARAVRAVGREPSQVLVVGGPAGDEELLGIVGRTLPDGVAFGRGNVGGTCPGESLGHRYAVALGLALAG